MTFLCKFKQPQSESLLIFLISMCRASRLVSGGVFDLFVAETVIRRKGKKPIETEYLLDLRTCLHFRSTCSANLPDLRQQANAA